VALPSALRPFDKKAEYSYNDCELAEKFGNERTALTVFDRGVNLLLSKQLLLYSVKKRFVNRRLQTPTLLL
jgi:hypothetical protein